MNISYKEEKSSVFRNTVVIIIAMLMLSACSGGVSGIMSSSGFGHWQIYRINYQAEIGRNLNQPTENVLQDIFFNLGFEKKYDWGKPFLAKARVATFSQKYRDRYITIDVQISEKEIIMMSTSYSAYTKDVFNNLESKLKEIFGEANIEKCYGTKDLDGHSCFNKKWG